MRGRLHSAEQRAEHMERVRRLYAKGFRPSEIATQTGVHRSQISYDLRVLARHSRLRSKLETVFATEQALMQVEQLMHDAWLGYEKSGAVLTEVRRRAAVTPEQIAEAKKKGTDVLAENLQEIERVTRAQNSDSRFLQIIQWCIRERQILLGLKPAQSNMLFKIEYADEATKFEATGIRAALAATRLSSVNNSAPASSFSEYRLEESKAI